MTNEEYAWQVKLVRDRYQNLDLAHEQAEKGFSIRAGEVQLFRQTPFFCLTIQKKRSCPATFGTIEPSVRIDSKRPCYVTSWHTSSRLYFLQHQMDAPTKAIAQYLSAKLRYLPPAIRELLTRKFQELRVFDDANLIKHHGDIGGWHVVFGHQTPEEEK